MLTENFCIIGGLIFLSITSTYADYIRNYDMHNYQDCDSQAKAVLCEQKCGINHACLLGRCICLKPKSLDDEMPRFHDNSQDDRFSDFDDYTEMTPLLHSQNNEEGRLALRHHIAHFCPNLKVARQFIRGCMKLGKPAFCGKDHVCYCGHKYDTPESAMKVNAKDVYAQFRDMYKKYFGANDGSEETVEEELDKEHRSLTKKDDYGDK